MAGFNMADYVDVAERIREFYERFPGGSLRTGTPPNLMDVAGKTFIVYHAQAFRAADDPVPGDGWAWEPVPGPTQFTKDSELMNAETAAWGRAIVSLGFATKKIASRQEVQGRSGAGTPGKKAAARSAEEAPNRPVEPAAVSTNGDEPEPSFPPNVVPDVRFASQPQRKRLFAIAKVCEVEAARLREILGDITGQESTAQIPSHLYDAVCAAVEAEAVTA